MEISWGRSVAPTGIVGILYTQGFDSTKVAPVLAMGRPMPVAAVARWADVPNVWVTSMSSQG